MDFRDWVIEEIQGWGWPEFVTLFTMLGLLIFGAVLASENVAAEWKPIPQNNSCVGEYHKDTRCLISVSDCWGAANHYCRQHKQMAKCINYSGNSYEYWNTTLNITQIRYDSTLCKCSYWCMNITEATSTTWTKVTTTLKPTSTTQTTTLIKWITLPQNVTLTHPTATNPPERSQPPEQRKLIKPQDQPLLWLIILLFIPFAAYQDLKTQSIERWVTCGFSLLCFLYGFVAWDIKAVGVGLSLTVLMYVLYSEKLVGLGDVFLAGGFGASMALLQPMSEEVLVASVGAFAFILLRMQKNRWQMSTEVPWAAMMLLYYLSILVMRIGVQLLK